MLLRLLVVLTLVELVVMRVVAGPWTDEGMAVRLHRAIEHGESVRDANVADDDDDGWQDKRYHRIHVVNGGHQIRVTGLSTTATHTHTHTQRYYSFNLL